MPIESLASKNVDQVSCFMFGGRKEQKAHHAGYCQDLLLTDEVLSSMDQVMEKKLSIYT